MNETALPVCRCGTQEQCEELLGKSAYEQSVIDSWCALAQNELELPRSAWVGSTVAVVVFLVCTPLRSAQLYPIYGFIPYSKEGTNKAKADVKRVLAVLNTHLSERQYLVGERVTLADIVLACTLSDLYRMVRPAIAFNIATYTLWCSQVLEPEFRAPFEHTTRWFVEVVSQPQFVAVIGELNLCETMAQVRGRER